MASLSIGNFEELLAESVKAHGHLCAGQVLGVRLALYGLRLVGIDDPKGKDRKSLLVFVEIDRCATDAIGSVTGCTLGKRSLKFVDYGMMAATFLNLKTGVAWRVVAKEEAREAARDWCDEPEDRYRCQLEAYKRMPDEELFRAHQVEVEISEYDLPGRPKRRVRCESCGEWVQDGRDVEQEGRILCRACAGGAYFRRLP